MTYSDHREGFEAIIEAIQGGMIHDAIEIAERLYIAFPEEKADTLYWKACLYAGSGRSSEAVSCFKEAFEQGIWWSDKTISSEEDLKTLYSDPDFQSIVASMNQLESLKKAESKIQTQFVGPMDKAKFAVHLHWKNDTIDHYRGYCEGLYEALGQKCLYIQSSQPDSSRGFCWEDEDLSIREITECLSGDFSKVEGFCGASQGGRLALKLAVANGVNYFGIMPAIRDLDILKSPIPSGMKFKWLIGSRDFFYAHVETLHRKLLEQGYDSRLEVVDGVGHYFAPALKAKLRDFLKNE